MAAPRPLAKSLSLSAAVRWKSVALYPAVSTKIVRDRTNERVVDVGAVVRVLHGRDQRLRQRQRVGVRVPPRVVDRAASGELHAERRPAGRGAVGPVEDVDGVVREHPPVRAEHLAVPRRAGRVGLHVEGPEEERDAGRRAHRVGDRLEVRIHAQLVGVVPGQPEHAAARDVRHDHDQLVALVGRQRTARVALAEISPGPHALRRQLLRDPRVQELPLEDALVEEQAAALAEALERLEGDAADEARPGQARAVLELREVEVGHDLLQLRDRVARGQQRRHDRAGRRTGHPVELVRIVALPQHAQGADEPDPLDAPTFEHQVCVRHVDPPRATTSRDRPSRGPGASAR